MATQLLNVAHKDDAKPGVNELTVRFVKACNVAINFERDSHIDPMALIAVVTDRLDEIQRACEATVSQMTIMDDPLNHLNSVFVSILRGFTSETVNNLTMSLGNNGFMDMVDSLSALVAQTFAAIVGSYQEATGYSASVESSVEAGN